MASTSPVSSLPGVRMLNYLSVAYNHYAIAHAYNAANIQAQGSVHAQGSAVNVRIEAKTLLSRRRQSDYSKYIISGHMCCSGPMLGS